MRFVTCLVDGGERAGLIDGDDIRLFPAGVALIDLLGNLARAAGDVSDDRLALSSAHLLAPIPRPPTLRDFYAFEQHVATARRARGQKPLDKGRASRAK